VSVGAGFYSVRVFEDLIGAELAAALATATADSTGDADPTEPAEFDDAARFGVLVDRVTAADRLIGWASAVQARAVAALAAGYEQHYLDVLPAAASGWDRGEAIEQAGRDCVVELGLARVTGLTAASNQIRFAEELITDHPTLLGLLEAGVIPVWNIRAALSETRILPSSLRRQADIELASLLPGMSWAEASQAAARVVIDLDPDAAAKRAEAAKAGGPVKFSV
jgi:hypothetical protein